MALKANEILKKADLENQARERRRASDNVLENVYELLMMNHSNKKKEK